MDRLGHSEDLFSGWLVVVHFFSVLPEMRHQLVVAVGAHSEGTRWARDLLCHVQTDFAWCSIDLRFWGLNLSDLNRLENDPKLL